MTILSSLTSGNTPRAPSDRTLPLISIPMMVVKPAPLLPLLGQEFSLAVYAPRSVFREKGRCVLVR
jgi:hypothetical protein